MGFLAFKKHQINQIVAKASRPMEFSPLIQMQW